jgi:hypothetical protein
LWEPAESEDGDVVFDAVADHLAEEVIHQLVERPGTISRDRP